MNIKVAQQEVEAFHKKHGYPVRVGLLSGEELHSLQTIYRGLQADVERRMPLAIEYQVGGDTRLYRTLLMIEEVSEWIEAINAGDLTKAADAIGDMLYIVLGHAVDHDLPAEEILKEVIKSNATKNKRNEESDRRLRMKGGDYKEPDMRAAIERGRDREAMERKLADGNV